ncbi:hypothetical protein Taro_013032 [Colocasia esculenta]|uniref:Uncharacterized protein n=1 Tax=Colocasia esculenta TaxID=4460 RepID=A0A843U5J6_COLES|nr:hypothetical protein [Colocasia esculenta]
MKTTMMNQKFMQSMCLMNLLGGPEHKPGLSHGKLSREGVLRLAVVVVAVGPELGARRNPVDFPMWGITSLIFQPKSQSQTNKKGRAFYLHPAYHYAMELSYDDDLTATFTRVVERLSRSALDAADAIDQTSINLPT